MLCLERLGVVPVVNTAPWNTFTIRQGMTPNKTAGNTTARIHLRNNEGMPPQPLNV